MQGAIATMQSKMNACLVKAVTTGAKTPDSSRAALEEQLKKVFGSRTNGKKKDAVTLSRSECYTKDVCGVACEPPGNTSPDCDNPEQVKNGKNEIGEYLTYLGKRKSCENKDYEALKKQKEVMDCQMAVLADGVKQASASLQSVLNNNGAQYGKMNQYMAELADQGSQIDALIGKDGKLTGLQAELYKNLNSMIENEAKFKNDAVELDEQTKQNAAYLDSVTAQKFGACMFGSTASTGAVQCWRPVATYSTNAQGQNQVSGMKKNKNGCPVYEKGLCSPAQAARSAIEMSYLTSNGKPYQDADRCAEALSASGNFDNVMNDISGKLGTDLANWSDIQKAYGSKIDSTAMGYLQNGAGTCTSNAESWKRNAQNPNKAKMDKESQTYATQKTKLNAMKNTLSASLDAGMTGLSKGYADVMAALSDQPVALSRVQCTKDNPTKMQECYANIRSSLQGLMEGNASLTTTTKTIKGGTLTPGFAVPCQGLNGCITTFQTVRDKIVDQSRLANQSKQKFVQDGNAQVSTQLQQFSQFLATTQASVVKQYDQMKAAFAAMGISAPDSMKSVDAEQLEPVDGPNGEKGPYKQPKNMSAVLSGMVQPGGLINMSDTGTKDAFAEAMQAAKDKTKGQGEAIKDWQDHLKDFNQAAKVCNADHAGSDLVACSSCQSTVDACTANEKSSAISEGNRSFLQNISDGVALILSKEKMSQDEVKTFQENAVNVKGLPSFCSNVKARCMQCFATQLKSSGTGADLATSGSAGSASEAPKKR